jgi:replicative DNA helicase
MAEKPNKRKGAGDRVVPGFLSGDRPQPHDLEAEKAILAAMMLEPNPCIDIATEKLGSASCFYSPAHSTIFKTLSTLYNDKDMDIDLISLSSELKSQGVLEELGGEIFLAEIQNSIATTANIETWCSIVSNYSMLREMINVCTEAMSKCYSNSTEVSELLNEIEGDIYKVRFQHVAPEIVEIKNHITTTFANIQKIINKEVEVGIPTGYPDLDKMIIGLKPGEMFVLAARPSIGKTSLALNVIRNVALKEHKDGNKKSIAFFSLEMTAEQITRRLLCTEAGIPESTFFDGSFKPSQITRLTGSVNTYKKAKIFIDPTAGITISELRAKSRRMKSMYGVDLIVIDYLQLMKASGSIESRQQEVAEISSGIKKLAKDLDVPVLVLAQLNREVEKGPGGKSARPKLSHLRESGAIEQDADVVTFLHRDRDETKDTSREAQKEGVDAELIVEKNRNGSTGIIPLKFIPHLMLFQPKEHRYSDDDRPRELNGNGENK